MSEGQPQALDQPVPEQQIPVIDGDTEGVHLDLQTNTEPTEGDDGRWDHQKAETLAAVVKEDGGFDEMIEAQEAQNDRLPSVDTARTTDDRGGLYDEVENLRFHAERDENLKERLKGERLKPQSDREEYFQEAIEENQGQLRAAEQALEEGRNKKIQEGHERIKKEVDRTLSPFEELYDTNPDRFASMPTSEFMALGRELSGIDKQFEEMNPWFDKFVRGAQTIDKCIEAKQRFPLGFVEDHFGNLGGVMEDAGLLGKDEEQQTTYDELEREYDSIFEGSFDKTPREQANALKAMTDKYIAKIQEKRDAMKAQRDELIGRYAPDSGQEEA